MKIHLAQPNKFHLKEQGWNNGNERAYIQLMSSGRYAIFRASPSGKSGYLIYDTQEELLDYFTLDDGKTTSLATSIEEQPALVY